MCQKCVSEGLYTQLQLDQLEAGENPTDVLTEEQINKVFTPQAIKVSADSEDVPEFLRKVLGERAARKSPEQVATERMDESVALILQFIREKRADATSPPDETALDNPRLLDSFLDLMAGEIMYKMHPSTIAYSMAMLADRYATLLDQWATLYVAAARDLDDLVVDLDQATTREAKDAVTRAGTSAPIETSASPYL